MTDTPFHEGEIAVQRRAGEQEAARRNGGGISTTITPGAQTFLALQNMLAVCTCGQDGQLWASVWLGPPGFARSSGDRSLELIRPAVTDPVARRLTTGAPVGLLAIDAATRRRLRINGDVVDVAAQKVTIGVRECFANCPKYIRRRRVRVGGPRAMHEPVSGRVLDERRRSILCKADTLFVGSIFPARGADVSHRGGAPGFARLVGDSTLRIADYPGNSMFQTLGNFAVDPRAAVATVDFQSGRMLAMSGTAQLVFGKADPNDPAGSTGRYWEFHVREWIELSLPVLVEVEELEASPFNPPVRVCDSNL